MKAHSCCQSQPRTGGGVARRSRGLRRLRELAGVLLPGTLLALSYTSAHLLLRGLTALCICTLAFCLVRRILKHLRQKHSLHLSPSNTHP